MPRQHRIASQQPQHSQKTKLAVGYRKEGLDAGVCMLIMVCSDGNRATLLVSGPELISYIWRGKTRRMRCWTGRNPNKDTYQLHVLVAILHDACAMRQQCSRKTTPLQTSLMYRQPAPAMRIHNKPRPLLQASSILSISRTVVPSVAGKNAATATTASCPPTSSNDANVCACTTST